MKRVIDEQQILEQNRRFHDEVEAKVYDQRMGVQHDDASMALTLGELARVFGGPLPRGGRVLDVAAGTGHLAVKLARTGHYDEVVAVDISEKCLEVARQNAAVFGCTITTHVSDMRRLPFEDNSFDLVVGCAFLHHLAYPVQFMSELARVMKPGTPFVIIGEGTKFFHQALSVVKAPAILANKAIRAMRRSDRPDFRWEHDNIDVHEFTIKDARELVAGFEDVKIVTEGFASPLIHQGLFSPLRYMVGNKGRLGKVLDSSEKVLEASDRAVFNRILPKGMRASLKLSGRKPAAA